MSKADEILEVLKQMTAEEAQRFLKALEEDLDGVIERARARATNLRSVKAHNLARQVVEQYYDRTTGRFNASLARKMIYDDLRPSLTGSDDRTRPTFMEVWQLAQSMIEELEAKRLQGESNREQSREF